MEGGREKERDPESQRVNKNPKKRENIITPRREKKHKRREEREIEIERVYTLYRGRLEVRNCSC